MSHYELSTEHNPMLAILGVVSKGDAPVKNIIGDVRSLIPNLWQPTRDVLALTVHRALRDRHLKFVDYPCSASDPLLTLTAIGRQQLQTLLHRMPANPPGPSSLVTETLKACFDETGELLSINPAPLDSRCLLP